MFTGLIEELGVWRHADDRGTQNEPLQRVTVECKTVLDGTQIGDSISVNGVCLTVVDMGVDNFSADVMGETLRLTTLALLQPGDPVNLERAVAVGQRIGGHIVQGHVDTTGRIAKITEDHVIRIRVPQRFKRFIAYKGSITVDGVSLTVSAVEETSASSDMRHSWCEVSLIPETLRRTTLGRCHENDQVNIEVDALAKYVDELLTPYRPPIKEI